MRKGRKLSADDCRAVDLLLDLGADNAHAVTRMAGAACQKRVSAATRLLAKLDAMPTAEPASDLVARTMARLEAAGPLTTGRAVAASATPLHLH